MSAKPVFLAPLGIEAVAIRRGARDGAIERIGMGRARATKSCAALAARLEPSRPVVLLGVCGAIDADLRAGEVVVASSLCSSDGALQQELRDPAQVVELLRSGGLSVRTGTIACSERIVKGEERAQIKQTGALAVEMEALWCLELAKSRPFAVVRVVLDVVGREVLSAQTPLAFVKAARSLASAARSLMAWSPDSVDGYPTLEVGA